jgi:transcriptional regulator with XRE-family HTH domain
MSVLTERIKKMRAEKRLSQEKLAFLLGVQPNTVWRWENNRASPMESIPKLAAALGTTVAYLMGETDDPLLPSERQTRLASANVYLANAIGVGDSPVVRNVNGTLTVNEQGEVRDSIVFEQGEGEKKIRLVFPYGTSGDVIAQIVSAMLK